MTELEIQLSKGLEALSAQYAQDMKVTQNQVTILTDQVMSLTKEVTSLKNQYEKIAELLEEELEQ